MTSMYSPSSGDRIFHPSRMCRIKSSDLYCVRMRIRRTSELIQLESVKSMIRYAPPNGTAGLGVSLVSGKRRSPAPPAKRIARTFSIQRKTLKTKEVLESDPDGWNRVVKLGLTFFVNNL